MLSFVQFPHPGAEHEPDNHQAPFEKAWNQSSEHSRKFLLSAGDYVNLRNKLVANADLLFWGEWEPPSTVEKFDLRPSPHHPQWLHRPFLPRKLPRPNSSTACGAPKRASKAGCVANACGQGGYQNTDPYVFEGPFKYLLCRQSRNRKLRTLDPGSVILFGSASGTGAEVLFQLDTVFVVGGHTEYAPAAWAKSLETPSVISKHYRDVVVRHAFVGGQAQPHFRLYRGATFSDRVTGMYSFAPAQVCKGKPVGFPRVTLRESDLPPFRQMGATQRFLTNNLSSAARCTTIGSLADAAQIWSAVRSACRAQGLVDAVQLNTPTVR